MKRINRRQNTLKTEVDTPKRKVIKLPMILVLLIGGLIATTIFFAIKSSNQGAILIALESQAYDLELQNQEIKSNIVSGTALSKISKEAATMGMDKPEKFVYLNTYGVALK